MSTNPPANTQRLMPRLSYVDAEAALRFLNRAFGFIETGRVAPEGVIAHAEMALDGLTVVALGGKSQKGAANERGIQIFCYVDDVDQHFQQSKLVAEVLSEPEDQLWGDRSYDVLDCGGYHWTFRQHVKDVPLEEIKRRIERNGT